MTEKLCNKRRVLIVDDDQSISQMLAMLLQARGYEVRVVASGAEALREVNSLTNPDIILLNLVLPDCEGFDVCRHLREESTTQHISIIVMSTRYMMQDKMESLYSGADDFVAKPFENEELFARMEAVLRRRVAAPSTQVLKGEGEIISELRSIITHEKVVPFFQPIFLLKPLKLLGLEVLSRAQTTSVLSNPEVLFKSALKYGFYFELEMLVWRKALQYAGTMLQDDERLFLNCNPYLVETPKFSTVKFLFETMGISPKRVVLELTERSEVRDFTSFYECLRTYRDYGFSLAIDDVGCGYSSLEAIVETHPEIVKIDRHLIAHVRSDPFKRSIVKFIVSFCRENHILSIAEGIENKEDLEVVADLGVDGVQGFFLARPTATLDRSELLRRAAQVCL